MVSHTSLWLSRREKCIQWPTALLSCVYQKEVKKTEPEILLSQSIITNIRSLWMVETMEVQSNSLTVSLLLSDFCNMHWTMVRLQIVWKVKHMTQIRFEDQAVL